MMFGIGKTQSKKKIKLAIVDDHRLFREGLKLMFNSYRIPHVLVFEANHGVDMQRKITVDDLPEVLLIDTDMPGIPTDNTINWLGTHHPAIRIVLMGTVPLKQLFPVCLPSGVLAYLQKSADASDWRRQYALNCFVDLFIVRE